MVEVFGDVGRHASSAVGVDVLPQQLGVTAVKTTEVELIVEIAPGRSRISKTKGGIFGKAFLGILGRA